MNKAQAGLAASLEGGDAPLRILVVSFQFPPFKGAGCLRVGKTAKYLRRFGHDVRVLTARNQNVPVPRLPVEIEPERITATAWLDPAGWFSSAPTSADQGPESRAAGEADTSLARQVLRLARHSARVVLQVPDREIGWFPYAYWSGSHMMRDWRPDVVYASAFPATSLLVGAALARRFNVPWVAEMRDLWAEFLGYSYPEWRRPVDTWLERRVLGSSSGIVAVSDPHARRLAEQYKKPTEVIYHGFDPIDYPVKTHGGGAGSGLRIVYTGNLYREGQDPAPLFEAINRLGERGRKIRVQFYGTYRAWIREVAEAYGVGEQVELCGTVAHVEALRAQCEADLLLVLLWNDPDEAGMYLTKTLEYLGSGRPILGVGCTENGAAGLIRERRAGAAAEDVEEIATLLDGWLREKQGTGCIAPLSADAGSGLSREAQTRKLEGFLRGVLASTPIRRPLQRLAR